MEIIKINNNIMCELGVCRNRAQNAIKFARAGIRGRIHVCDDCLSELYSAIGKTIVPRSVETGKRKTKESKTNKEEAK